MMFHRLKYHWVAFFFAILLGILSGLPQLVAVERLGTQFGGVYPTNNDDEIYYLARGQDVLDGHVNVAQPYLWEGKDRLPLQFWVPDLLIAKFAQSIGRPLHDAFVALDFVFPGILFLLTYAISYLLTRERVIALSIGATLHFAIYFVLFNRPLSPQFNFIFFLGFILSLLHWENAPSRTRTVVVGLMFGLLFHVYAYYWTYGVVFFALFTLGLFVTRKWQLLKQIFFALGIAALIAVPYVYQLMRSFHYEFYEETVRRVGMIETHMPSGVYIVGLALLFCAFLLILLFTKKIAFDGKTLLVTSMVLAAPIVTNQHIITGGNLEFSSHYRWLATFVSVFGCGFLWGQWLRVANFPQKRRWVMLVSGAVIGWAVFLGCSAAYAQTLMRNDEVELQRYGKVFSWFREETKVDSVVFADQELSSLFPAYTQNNVYFAREANLHYVFDAEIKQRFAVSRYFVPTTTKETLQEYERSIWGTYYINRWQHQQQSNKLRKLLGITAREMPRYPEEEFSEMLERVNSAKQKDFRDVIAPYRVDYVVWDKKKYPEWNIEEGVSKLQLVYTHDDIFVYRVMAP